MSEPGAAATGFGSEASRVERDLDLFTVVRWTRSLPLPVLTLRATSEV